ncbi:MAG: chemotaxis protein CheW [Isosphaeraceae bacterium]
MLLLTFTAGSKRYAVDVLRVVEVLPKVELHPILHAPDLVAGLLNYRGKVIPVFDLGLLLDKAPCRNLLSSRTILVNDVPGDQNQGTNHPAAAGRSWPAPSQAPVLLGLLAENVDDLTYIRPEQVMPAPVQLPDAPYLDAIVRTDHEIVSLIAVQKIRDYLHSSVFANQSAVLYPQTINPESMDSVHENRVSET